MNNKQLQSYRTYQRFIRNMLITCGCWHLPTKSGRSLYCWSIFVLLIQILYVTVNVITSYKLRYNFNLMIINCKVILSALGTTLKVLIFLINRESLITQHRILDELFEEELVRNEKIRITILSSLRQISTIAYLYFISLWLLILGYFLSPYIFIIRNIGNIHLITNYSLPLTRGYGYFWTVPKNYLYHFHLLFETLLVLISNSTTSGVDSAFGFYVYQFASTLRAMAFRIVNLQPTENYSDVLKACVAKHQILLPCRNTLENVYGPIIFWHVVTNAMLLCMLLYETFTTNSQSLSIYNTVAVVSLLAFCLVKLLQTFSYSWYGTVFTNASEQFRMGIYFGEWFNSKLDRHMRTNIILILMQKPLTINAVFTPVDVVMFTNFVNSTMSYFFLLQSIRDGQT